MGETMADPAPKTDKWSARENVHKPKGVHIIVSGNVQVGSTNKVAVLRETKGPGDVLMLDLTIEDGEGEGADVMVWTLATYHKEVDTDQFNKVTVRWDTKAIATFPVIDDRQHATLAATQHKAQNAVVGTVKKAAAAPKKAAKKAAKKAKKAAKAVKKAVKKVAKKKAAKKSTLKRAPAKKKKKGKKR
jgi:hypothetical protein